MWQAELPLPSAWPARPPTQPPTDLQGLRQERLRIAAHARRRPQGRARSGRSFASSSSSAHTREAKLGCVFTQTAWDEDGFAIRDPDSTTYTGAIETAEEFGKRLYLEAWNRGWSRAQKKVVIGDGAEWIWNLADQHFPSAVQIVDLFHAREHLWDLARRLYP